MRLYCEFNPLTMSAHNKLQLMLIKNIILLLKMQNHGIFANKMAKRNILAKLLHLTKMNVTYLS